MDATTEAALAAVALRFGPAGRALGGEVTFELGPGSVLAVLGANGAGKTTLFRTLLGALAPLGGEVLWGGAPVAGLSPDALARQAAWVPQSPGSGFDFTVDQYALLGALGRLRGLGAPSREDREAAREAVAQLGLEHLRERRLSQLSGGERQLAALARAVVQRARVLVLDEPAASLDLANQAHVLGRLSRLARSGLAVVFSTHDPNHALRIAGQALVLRRGESPRLGPVARVVTPEVLGWAYGAGVDVARRADGSIVIAGVLPDSGPE